MDHITILDLRVEKVTFSSRRTTKTAREAVSSLLLPLIEQASKETVKRSIATEPIYDSLRSDGRFQELLRLVGPGLPIDSE